MGNRAVVSLLNVQRQSESDTDLLEKRDNRPMLRQGSTGPHVVDLQSDLNQVGAQPALIVDGIFGSLTRKEVVKFQMARGLLVDGIVGPQTWGALDDAKSETPPDGDDEERVLDRLDRLDRLGDDLVDLGDHIIPGIGPYLANPPNPLQKPPPNGKKPPSSKTGDQLESWMLPHQKHNPIGQVHFATNNTELTDDDMAALDRLVDVVETYRDKFMFDPFVIEFHGFADPRKTSYPGGNDALGRDRAKSCYDYFKKKLSKKASRSVKPRYLAKGARPELAKALGIQLAKRGKTKTIDRQMRTVAIVAPDALPHIRPCPKPANRAAALAHCRKVLTAKKSRFSPIEYRRLKHILEDKTTRDGYLNGLDRELVKIAYGLQGPDWTPDETEAFVNRHKVEQMVMKCYVGGPNAPVEDTVGGLKILHSLIEQGLSHLAEGTGKDMISGAANRRRVRLNNWVDKAKTDSKSVYYKWF